MSADTDQRTLAGDALDEDAGQREFVFTVEDAGLTYAVVVPGESYADAERRFEDECDFYEVSVEDHDFEWDHEAVWATSEENAREIALERDRDWARVTEAPNLGNDADVTDVTPLSKASGIRVRKAVRDAKVVREVDA